jgi:hypothetical protein
MNSASKVVSVENSYEIIDFDSKTLSCFTLNKTVVTQPATNETHVLSYLNEAAVLVFKPLVIQDVSVKDDFIDVDLVLLFQSSNSI